MTNVFEDVEYNESEAREATPPQPRKYPVIWSHYLFHRGLMRIATASLQRQAFIKAGKCNLDLYTEEQLHAGVKAELDKAAKSLKLACVDHPAWDWLSNIKGLGSGHMKAQLLGLIDDIEKFPTVSKLWRFSGYGLHPETGQVDKRQSLEHSPYSGRLKGLLYNIGDSFIKQQTPRYSDIYYAEKAKQQALHPEVEKIEVKGKNGKTKTIERYTAGHLDFRARRKMIKAFLKDFWVAWRKAEGLPLTQAYEERTSLDNSGII